ncbi:MAG: MucBP domain-containing protein [Bacilli bacterium]
MKKIIIGILTMLFSLSVISNVKAEEFVAKIGDTNYASLDEAVEASKDGDTITLLQDAETEGLNLSKDLIIDGKNENGENYKVTFTKYGIALWGKSLTFKNTSVFMTKIGSTPYTAEWNWVTICASKNSTINLINSNMVMDGKDAGNKHAIYFTGNDKLNLTNSNLTIKNYTQDALEWDGGDAGYNVNLKNSTIISDNNRSGFTGTFIVKSENSNIDVINSTGNGSNGSSFELIKSTINFNNNGAHGLSASDLIIDDSTVNAIFNGANGIHVTGKLDIKNYSNVTIQNNDCSISSKWTIPGALYVAGESNIDKSTTLLISNNNGSGIYVKNTGTLNLETGIITENNANKLGLGGGINNNGITTIAEGVEIYNNKASIAGDDIISTNILVLPSVVQNKYLLASTIIRNNEISLNDCTDLINGWYDDSEISESEDSVTIGGRWNAHGEEKHIELVNADKYEGILAIKAAHNLEGKVITHYVDEEGNTLLEDKTINGYVDDEYQTTAEEIDGYTLIEVKGEEKGKITEGDTEVTYIYQFTKGQGTVDPIEPLPPHTSSNNSIFILLILVNALGASVLLKKSY